MHAAVEAGTEDGNAALAGCAAGRQGGRRAAVLLRHANPTDVHHHICSDKAFPQRSRCTFPIGRRGPAHQASRTSIRIVLNYVKNRHAQRVSPAYPVRIQRFGSSPPLKPDGKPWADLFGIAVRSGGNPAVLDLQLPRFARDTDCPLKGVGFEFSVPSAYVALTARRTAARAGCRSLCRDEGDLPLA